MFNEGELNSDSFESIESIELSQTNNRMGQESSEERELRLRARRSRYAVSRANETAEQRELRLARRRNRESVLRANETTEQRELRLATKRYRTSVARANETAEQRELRLSGNRERASVLRANETAEQREMQLAAKREREILLRANETAEQREIRLGTNRERTRLLRAIESGEQREERLQASRIVHAETRLIRRRADLYLEGFNYNPAKTYQNHPKIDIGKMSTVCHYCLAHKYKVEPPGMCCSNGKVKLIELDPPAEPLHSLLYGSNSESTHFLYNIRKYNSCFQMTSFGTTVDNNINNAGFMSTFKIQGQIYHKIGTMLPQSGESHKFLQIYFIGDDNKQVDQRYGIIPSTRNQNVLKRDIVYNLQKLLHEKNKLVNLFKTALEKMPTDEWRLIIRADQTPLGEHERRFNAPTIDEVAIVRIGDDDAAARDIVLHKRDHNLKRIVETHRSYDALQYPLIFWKGEDGYHFNLKQINPQTGLQTNKKVSANDFYAYRIMIRSPQKNHILMFRQLFHQYIVDMYAKIEAERLLFIRLNQKKLRVEQYIHLRDAVMNDVASSDVGQMAILPATYIGSPRHMHEYAQDAMSYVRAFGRPDLFITFTCNPGWSEIKEELIQGQTPADRHDLTARIFKQKLIKLMQILTKICIYGEVRCYLYSIEWQKRGLPHAHILIWLKEKLRPVDIDKVISAEIPNSNEDPLLYEIVTKHMIHGPCGEVNPTSPCMKDNKCTKRFPRNMVSETQTAEDGYPLYRRRKPQDGGKTANIKMKINNQYQNIEIDNRWIVPYSPMLSKMFQAHINVECCNSVKSIKYICKYVNKGSDMAVVELQNANGTNAINTNDEITQYQLGRYISSNEAVWRILGFSIHERHPAVVHLSVHLENGQRVYFNTDNIQHRVEQPPNTTLTAFFQLCQNDDFAKTLLYMEVPKYYTWNNANKTFSRRKKGIAVSGHSGIYASDALGRVYTVHPSNSECFYLRLLLHNISGPTSFIYLKTVNGQVCQTYREACHALGLLENDTHWDTTLHEASETQFSCPQLRDLFVIIITTCSPTNPTSLWDKYKLMLSEDIIYQHRLNNTDLDLQVISEDIYNIVLIQLEDKCLSISGKPLTEFGLPAPNRQASTRLDPEVLRERGYDMVALKREVALNKPRLTADQAVAYSEIMSLVATGIGGIFYLDAPGGTGKTFLINLILNEVRSNGDIALAVASSGIAATLLKGGRTAHSALKLPLDVANSEIPVCNISKNSGKAEVLKNCKIIVWDECTMAHKRSLEALDRTMRDLKNDNRIMGGVVVLLAGDFRQTLPIIPRGTPADELNACLKASVLWKDIKTKTLTSNMRVRIFGDNTSENFAKKLLSIGDGKYPVDSTSGLITLTSDLCTLVTSMQQMIRHVFPQIELQFQDPQWLSERAILAPTNDQVNKINNDILERIPGNCIKYQSINTIVEQDQVVNYPTEFLNSLELPGFPQHILRLKIGSPIMLMRNLDPPKLCNGTRLRVSQLKANVIHATILTGNNKGENVFIPRIPLISNHMPFDFRRLQFPVRLSFCMTINKAQGQSLKFAGVNLESQCFSHGQLYVAFSRVGSPQHLYVYAPDGQTKNIVYPKALQ